MVKSEIISYKYFSVATAFVKPKMRHQKYILRIDTRPDWRVDTGFYQEALSSLNLHSIYPDSSLEIQFELPNLDYSYEVLM